MIEVDRSTVLVGKEIPIYTRLANLSGTTIYVPVTTTGLAFGLDVRDAAGRPVAETEPGRERKDNAIRAQDTPDRFKMIPKFRVAGSVDLSNYLDMTSPGTYSVQLYWPVPEDFGGGEIRSNVLRITVRARNTQP